MPTTSVPAGGIGRGIDQDYYPGYVLDWASVTLTPEAGDDPLSANDPWRLRLIYGDVEEFLTPTKTMNGTSLVLSARLTAEKTAELGKHGSVRVVVEYDPNDAPRPRLYHMLNRAEETGPTRSLSS